MDARKVRCREIVEADIEAVSELLTCGFAGRTRDYWLRGLHRQGEREVPPGCPQYGYLLESDGRPVGVLLLLYTQRIEAGEPNIRCNVSSWYVAPEFRNYATLLTSMAQKHKHVTYINISPAANTWPIIEAQGFRRYCSGMLFSVPLLSRGERGMTVEVVTGATAAVAGLPEAELDRLRSHADYGCLSLVCRIGGEAIPFIMLPKRMKSGRFPMPAMQLVYCRDIADFVRCARALGGFLIRRGRPLVVVDANGPVAGLTGIYTETRGRKYFKGPNPPRLADLTETELVLYGP
ncbi:acyl-CoA acyltransferase [Rhodopseudomonas palustris]|uniref:acyl-CoA acyltransferase n=1 Tax=Rhodopseudomonas palustris TaxID=1076 RepID=UPI002ACEBEAB|nr:acyl-CoA acyltransferase [Rhodopseudomonas palustris]WQG98109.1 acyl-CoA acyltransferase [Rhodopseudomonas palustris]